MSGPEVLPEHVDLVLSALHGRDAQRAVTKAWLAMSTGLPTRQIEATIEHIRRESVALVASGGEGYWLPATLEEAEENIGRRHSRAIHQIETCQGERALIARMREAEAPRPTLWPALTPGCWCRVGSVESKVHGERGHVTHADAPSPLRAAVAPSEGARVG